METENERLNLPSASGMYRIAYCPGSRAAEAGLSELPSLAVTESGTNIHAALEDGDDEELNLTEKEIAVRLRDMIDRAIQNWKVYYNISGEVETIKEERFWIRNRATLELMASAKPDVICFSGEYALTVDAKTGFKKTTPAERNYQVHSQVVSAWQHKPEVKVVRGAIAAGRLSFHFDSCDYDLADLSRMERDLQQVIWKAGQQESPRVPGEHCRYCRANGVCREKAVYDSISQSQLPVKSGKPEALDILNAVARLTPQEIAHLYKRKASMEFAYEAMEFRLKSLPADVLEGIGFKVAPGNKTPQIVDVGTAFNRLGDLLTPEERMQCVKMSVAKAAEILADRTKVSKESAKAAISETIGDAMMVKIGNPKLKAL